MADETEPPRKKLTPEAERALAEAAARRRGAEKLAAEQGGPNGPEAKLLSRARRAPENARSNGSLSCVRCLPP